MSWWAWYLTGMAAGGSWPWWFSAYFNLENYLYERKHCAGNKTLCQAEETNQT